MKKCLVIGAAMLDIIMQIDRLPKSGEDAYASSQEMTVGGCAYNVADILSHFQVPHTLFAPIGTGMYANFIEKVLKDQCHESPVKSDKMDNGYCLCMVEASGERTFLTLPGIECRFEKAWFENLDVENYDSVYVSGYEIEGEGGDNIISFLEANPQLTVYYAPGPRITYIDEKKQERLYSLSPVIHLNEMESISFTGSETALQAAEILYQKTQNSVIVTLGEKGVYLFEGEKGTLVPSTPVNVVDTIGAGDSHIGAVIAMRQQGRGTEHAIQTANKVSALVVGVKGPTLTKEQFQGGEF